MKKIHVVKIGGNLINNKKLLDIFLKSFCKLKENKILVHGGGKKANSILNQMGIKNQMIKGRRITDKKTLDVVIMTYAGIINKNIVALLQKNNCNALGLSGADGNCIRSTFRKKRDIDYGYVGEIINNKNINIHFIKFLLIKNIIPVFCSITHNGKGILLNTNADTIASNIAVSLTKNYDVTELHFCFEKKGVLKKIEKDSESFFSQVSFQSFIKMKKNHTIKNGMIPKLENGFFALKNGVSKVTIGSPNSLNDLKNDDNKTLLCL